KKQGLFSIKINKPKLSLSQQNAKVDVMPCGRPIVTRISIPLGGVVEFTWSFISLIQVPFGPMGRFDHHTVLAPKLYQEKIKIRMVPEETIGAPLFEYH